MPRCADLIADRLRRPEDIMSAIPPAISIMQGERCRLRETPHSPADDLERLDIIDNATALFAKLPTTLRRLAYHARLCRANTRISLTKENSTGAYTSSMLRRGLRGQQANSRWRRPCHRYAVDDADAPLLRLAANGTVPYYHAILLPPLTPCPYRVSI